MKLFFKHWIHLFLANGVALYVIPYVFSGFDVEHELQTIAFGALALTASQLVVRPILKAISFPINVITLGFFNLIINAIVLFIAIYFVDGITYANGEIIRWSLPFVGDVIPVVELSKEFTLLGASIGVTIINWIVLTLVL